MRNSCNKKPSIKCRGLAWSPTVKPVFAHSLLRRWMNINKKMNEIDEAMIFVYKKFSQRYLKFDPSPFPSPQRGEGGSEGGLMQNGRDKLSDFCM